MAIGALVAAGSSPLTRGKRRRLGARRSDLRLIPAHAGKTSSRSPGWPESAAHPRSRGENGLLLRGVDKTTGSSPLTRGKLRAGLDPGGEPRLIPAHAGKTCCRVLRRARGRAHPRSRGENLEEDSGLVDFLGSSPLTRGKPYAATSWWAGERLIPAHAGKTCAPPSPPGSAPAHPRSRGENGGRHGSGDLQAGSSPLTRGKRLLSRLRGLLSRLIPAHAGKTIPLRPR